MRLYLLVPSTSSVTRALEVNGRLWSLEPFDLDSFSDNDDLSYSCISYTWGTGRKPGPFDPAFLISDRTIPALETFTQQRPSCIRIWIDALCVPMEEPERTQTLESMGYIYARAEDVMVVLSSAALPAITRMLDSNRLDVNDLAILEREGWVERAWTYQETVNSKSLLLSCEGDTSISITAIRFFDCLGHALAKWSRSMQDKLHVYPRLNAFEDAIADFYTASYNDRAALNVMSNMDRRVQERKEDHFYAMIGAVSAERSSSDGTLPACEAFMSVCEAKGDFSFIYSASQRLDVPTKRWRPIPGDLPSVLPWHTYGNGQPGRLSHEGLWLEAMLVLQPSQPQDDARQFIQLWLTAFWQDERSAQKDLPIDSIKEDTYAALQIMGFAGGPQCVTCAEGLFYPFEPLIDRQALKILVSTALRWRMGAPGFIECGERVGQGNSYVPGVYVGLVEKNIARSILLSI